MTVLDSLLACVGDDAARTFPNISEPHYRFSHFNTRVDTLQNFSEYLRWTPVWACWQETSSSRAKFIGDWAIRVTKKKSARSDRLVTIGNRSRVPANIRKKDRHLRTEASRFYDCSSADDWHFNKKILFPLFGGSCVFFNFRGTPKHKYLHSFLGVIFICPIWHISLNHPKPQNTLVQQQQTKKLAYSAGLIFILRRISSAK